MTCAPTQAEPDSHEERLARVRQLVRQPRQRMAPGLREVRAATQVFRHLAERVGPVDPQGEIPRAIRRQHWSAVYVPLMWAAACGDRECPQWLGHAASGGPPIVVGGVEMAGEDAVYAGWDALRETMSSWGIETREDLSEWIHNQGFVQPRWGAHFCARAQERILNGAVIRDVRCAALESACVQITLQACQRGLPPEPSHSQQGQTSGDTAGLTDVEDVSHTSWVRLDGVDLQEFFDRRLRVMQCCPHF